MRFRCAIVLALACGAATGTLLAQEGGVQPQAAQPQPAPVVFPPSGPQIRSVSAYAVYDSSFLPNGGAGFQPGSANLPADFGAGGSIVLEWNKFTERSTFALNYTPSYTGYVRNSQLNALNHALSLTISHKIAPRWTLSFSAAGNLSSLEQSLFAPTTLGNVAAAPATFNDLAAAMLSAKFTTNPLLGTILTSSPLVESPISNLLYGQRMFTSSAYVSLSHSYSPRLSVTVSGGGARTQQVSQNQTPGTTTAALIPNTTSGNASVGLSYSLSPFTQVGGTATTIRTSSSIFDSYTTNALATLGHTFAMRWLIQLHGGVGFISPVRQIAAVMPAKPGPVIGGSLVYKTMSHTFLGSYDRTVSDSYGLGAATTSTATASWHWRHPGNSWWFDSSFNWQQLLGGALATTSGWHTTVGLTRTIGTHIALMTQYVHMNYSGGLQATTYHFSQDAMRVSIAWTPRPAALP